MKCDAHQKYALFYWSLDMITVSAYDSHTCDTFFMISQDEGEELSVPACREAEILAGCCVGVLAGFHSE